MSHDVTKHVYVKAVVQGKQLSADIYDGQVEGVEVWLGSLCGATKQDIDQIIEWLQNVKKEVTDASH